MKPGKRCIPDTDEFIAKYDDRDYKNCKFSELKSFAERNREALGVTIEERILKFPNPLEEEFFCITIEKQHGTDKIDNPKYVTNLFRRLHRKGCIYHEDDS